MFLMSFVFLLSLFTIYHTEDITLLLLYIKHVFYIVDSLFMSNGYIETSDLSTRILVFPFYFFLFLCYFYLIFVLILVLVYIRITLLFSYILKSVRLELLISLCIWNWTWWYIIIGYKGKLCLINLHIFKNSRIKYTDGKQQLIKNIQIWRIKTKYGDISKYSDD